MGLIGRIEFVRGSQPWFRGLTSAQWLILFVAWLGWVFDVMDAAIFNLAKGPMLTQMLGGTVAYKVDGEYTLPKK